MLLNLRTLRKQILNKGFTKTASRVIAEASAAPLNTKWDVFLSYSSLDRDALPLIIERLKEERLSVYVDAIADADLNPAKVSFRTADRIRTRLMNSNALFVLTSRNVADSRWVPWEIGFADGAKMYVAVLPFIDDREDENDFAGAEYFGLYPYVDDALSRSNTRHLWATSPLDPSWYCRLDKWLGGKPIYAH